MKRRPFTQAFKREAVRLVGEGRGSIAKIARGLDLHPDLLRRWVRNFTTRGQMMPVRDSTQSR